MPASDQGVSSDRYAVIPRVLILLIRDNQVLLLKGSADKRLWANRFNGIGGHIEPGEDPLSAAYRELFEETGLYRDNTTKASEKLTLWLCGVLLVNTGKNPGVCIFIFSGETGSESMRSSPEGTLHWVNLDQVESLPIVEDLPVILNRIKSMKQGDEPFFACSSYDVGKITVSFIK